MYASCTLYTWILIYLTYCPSNNRVAIVNVLSDVVLCCCCYVLIRFCAALGVSYSLAAEYTAIIFMFHLKFNVQATRKSIAHIQADDLVWCAAGMYSIGYVCKYVSMHVCKYVCMYLYMHACACMYVCRYAIV